MPEKRDCPDLTSVGLAEVSSRLERRHVMLLLVLPSGVACVARPRSGLQSIIVDAAEWWTPAFERHVAAILHYTAEGELREVHLECCSDDAVARGIDDVCPHGLTLRSVPLDNISLQDNSILDMVHKEPEKSDCFQGPLEIKVDRVVLSWCMFKSLVR